MDMNERVKDEYDDDYDGDSNSERDDYSEYGKNKTYEELNEKKYLIKTIMLAIKCKVTVGVMTTVMQCP